MRTRLIAVIGSGGKLSEEQEEIAERLGAALVMEGYGIVCGGLGGVMEAVCRGAAEARGDERHPPLIGLLPKYDPGAGNEFLDVALPTGLLHARNALVAAGGEAVVCVGGAMGALSELALARKIGRPVICLAVSGGTAQLASKALPAVIAVRPVEQAIERIKDALY